MRACKHRTFLPAYDVTYGVASMIYNEACVVLGRACVSEKHSASPQGAWLGTSGPASLNCDFLEPGPRGTGHNLWLGRSGGLGGGLGFCSSVDKVARRFGLSCCLALSLAGPTPRFVLRSVKDLSLTARMYLG